MHAGFCAQALSACRVGVEGRRRQDAWNTAAGGAAETQCAHKPLNWCSQFCAWVKPRIRARAHPAARTLSHSLYSPRLHSMPKFRIHVDSPAGERSRTRAVRGRTAAGVPWFDVGVCVCREEEKKKWCKPLQTLPRKNPAAKIQITTAA